MARVVGIGGIFFRSPDASSLGEWYKKHLGLPVGEDGSAMLPWRDAQSPENEHFTVWSPFPRDTKYFGPGDQTYMINYVVEDLDGLLEELRAQGVWIDENREDHPYGRFAWIKDSEGNRMELWEPPKADAQNG